MTTHPCRSSNLKQTLPHLSITYKDVLPNSGFFCSANELSANDGDPFKRNLAIGIWLWPSQIDYEPITLPKPLSNGVWHLWICNYRCLNVSCTVSAPKTDPNNDDPFSANHAVLHTIFHTQYYLPMMLSLCVIFEPEFYVLLCCFISHWHSRSVSNANGLFSIFGALLPQKITVTQCYQPCNASIIECLRDINAFDTKFELYLSQKM